MEQVDLQARGNPLLRKPRRLLHKVQWKNSCKVECTKVQNSVWAAAWYKVIVIWNERFMTYRKWPPTLHTAKGCEADKVDRVLMLRKLLCLIQMDKRQNTEGLTHSSPVNGHGISLGHLSWGLGTGRPLSTHSQHLIRKWTTTSDIQLQAVCFPCLFCHFLGLIAAKRPGLTYHQLGQK